MPFALLAFLVILFEEWVWHRAAQAMRAIARLPIIAKAEQRLKEAPPWVAVLAFFVPAILLFPAKLAGIWLLTHHHAVLGALVFLAAKVIGAASLARVFALTETTLRSISWINKSLTWILCKKDALKDYVLQSAPIRRARGVYVRIKSKFKQAKENWTQRRMNKALRKQRRLSASDSGSSK